MKCGSDGKSTRSHPLLVAAQVYPWEAIWTCASSCRDSSAYLMLLEDMVSLLVTNFEIPNFKRVEHPCLLRGILEKKIKFFGVTSAKGLGLDRTHQPGSLSLSDCNLDTCNQVGFCVRSLTSILFRSRSRRQQCCRRVLLHVLVSQFVCSCQLPHIDPHAPCSRRQSDARCAAAAATASFSNSRVFCCQSINHICLIVAGFATEARSVEDAAAQGSPPHAHVRVGARHSGALNRDES